MSNSDFYSDDPVDFDKPKSKRRFSGIITLIAALVGGTFYIQSTLAANISLNSGSGVEFGQGVAQIVTCSGSQSLTITPIASFVNLSGSGAHKFASITVANIPAGCDGVDFKISAYDSSNSTPLAIFNSTVSTAYIYNNSGSYSAGIWGTGLTITTNSSSSFTATFATPVALSANVHKISIESVNHTVISCATGGTCSVGDTGPGGGKVFAIASGSGSGLNYEFATDPVPSGGLSFSTFGNILFKWCNLTTGTIAGSLGSAIGTGKQNTVDMVAACSSGAAVAASGYSANGFSDWFLPSRSELAAFRPTLTTIMTGKGWGGTERIWTSTQGGTGNTDAWFIGLDSYTNAQDGKGQNYPVFPIRSWAG
ncbi:MAG: hypothetical protein QNL78_01585 [Actinomycetes bacterium]